MLIGDMLTLIVSMMECLQEVFNLALCAKPRCLCAGYVDDDGERAVLQVFYEQAGGSHWLTDTNWLTNNSVCSWFGIQCNQEGRVVKMCVLVALAIACVLDLAPELEPCIIVNC